jgi:hypothetical protein
MDKNPIVTMDAVKKAGFTNLRDYLNDKRGLKRRDGKAAERTEEFMAKKKAAAPTPMDDATIKAVTKNTLEQKAIRGEQDPATLAKKVEPSRGRGGLNKGVTGGANYAPKTVVKGPSAEEKAAAADKAAAKKQKSIDDMKATQDRMSEKRKEKSGFKLFPKMKKGGSVRGDGIARKGKTKGRMV